MRPLQQTPGERRSSACIGKPVSDPWAMHGPTPPRASRARDDKGSHKTLRWREQDSNHRSPVRRAAILSLPPSPAESVVVVAEVMVPAEIAAQIARLRSPTANGALPSLRWKFE